MTLDEAIAHARDVAEEQRKACDLAWIWDNPDNIKKCAEEHEQLVEWLEELKSYRASVFSGYMTKKMLKEEYCKAIDDIVIKIKECVGMDWEWDFMFIEQIAEQLKAGGK